MHNKKKERIYDLLAQLSVLFDDRPSEERLIAFCEVLHEYPMSDIEKSIKRAITESERFPTVARLVKNMLPDVTQVDDAANRIAGEIISGISRFGRYNYNEAKKSMSNSAIQVVESFGGWALICETTTAQLNTVRAQLRDIARGISRQKSHQQLKLENTQVVKMIETKKEGHNE